MKPEDYRKVNVKSGKIHSEFVGVLGVVSYTLMQQKS